MRLRLRLNRDTEESIREELERKEIEISEDADLILTEENYHDERLYCRDGADTVIILLNEICHIESLGHDVYVHTMDRKYKTDLRIYQLSSLLPPKQFIRISNSVIIQKNSIYRIRPGLSCKFYLTLKNGANVDVTRTYYYKFKEFYGI